MNLTNGCCPCCSITPEYNYCGKLLITSNGTRMCTKQGARHIGMRRAVTRGRKRHHLRMHCKSYHEKYAYSKHQNAHSASGGTNAKKRADASFGPTLSIKTLGLSSLPPHQTPHNHNCPHHFPSIVFQLKHGRQSRRRVHSQNQLHRRGFDQPAIHITSHS